MFKQKLHIVLQKLKLFLKKLIKFSVLSTIFSIAVCLFFDRNPIEIFTKKSLKDSKETEESKDELADSIISISFLLPCFYLVGYFLPKALAIVGMIVAGCALHLPQIPQFFMVDPQISAFFQKIAFMLILFRTGFSIELKNIKRIKFSMLTMIFLFVAFEMIYLSLFSVYLLKFNWLTGLALGSLLAGASPLVVDGWIQRINDEAGLLREVPPPAMVECWDRMNQKGMINFRNAFRLSLDRPYEELKAVLRIGGAFSEMLSICTFLTVLRFVFDQDECFQAILIPLPFEIFFAILAGLLGGFLVKFCSETRIYFDYLKTEDEDRISFLKSSILSTVLILTGSFTLMRAGEMIGCFVFGPIAVFFFGFFTRLTMKKKKNHILARIKAQLSLLCTIIFFPLLFGLQGFRLGLDVIYRFYGDDRRIFILIFIIVLLFLKTAIMLLAKRPILGKRKQFFTFISLPKVTTQASLGAVLLDRALREGRADLEEAGELILITSILWILIFSPPSMINIQRLVDRRSVFDKVVARFKKFQSQSSINEDIQWSDLRSEMKRDNMPTLPPFLWLDYLIRFSKYDSSLNLLIVKERKKKKKSRSDNLEMKRLEEKDRKVIGSNISLDTIGGLTHLGSFSNVSLSPERSQPNENTESQSFEESKPLIRQAILSNLRFSEGFSDFEYTNFQASFRPVSTEQPIEVSERVKFDLTPSFDRDNRHGTVEISIEMEKTK